MTPAVCVVSIVNVMEESSFFTSQIQFLVSNFWTTWLGEVMLKLNLNQFHAVSPWHSQCQRYVGTSFLLWTHLYTLLPLENRQLK